MLRIATAEWEEWGRLIVEGWDRRFARGAEAAPENFARVLAYWAAVPEGPEVIARHRALYAALLEAMGGAGAPQPALPLWAYPPWSAAFVSYVARAAGVDAAEFPPSAAHAFYIDRLLAHAVAYPAAAPFVPREPEAHAPRPGDLVCADRSSTPLPHWTARLAEAGEFRPMHCDIVVAAGAGAVEAVGGNVGDAVTKRRFPADAAGRLLPAPFGEAPFVVVLENRLGRLPPWDPAAPAIAHLNGRPAS